MGSNPTSDIIFMLHVPLDSIIESVIAVGGVLLWVLLFYIIIFSFSCKCSTVFLVLCSFLFFSVVAHVRYIKILT